MGAEGPVILSNVCLYFGNELSASTFTAIVLRNRNLAGPFSPPYFSAELLEKVVFPVVLITES